MYSRSAGFIWMRRRPKPHRSLKPGCTPTLTPCSFASMHSRCMVLGSPAWKPQATLADLMIFISSASLPMS